MGMPKLSLMDLTFGKRTVIGFSGTNSYRQSMWKVECECGKIDTVIGQALKQGLANTCRSCSSSKGGKCNTVEVVAFNKDNHLVRYYPSLSSAVADGYSIGNISSCLNGRLKTYKGLTWEKLV